MKAYFNLQLSFQLYPNPQAGRDRVQIHCTGKHQLAAYLRTSFTSTHWICLYSLGLVYVY